jgi:hypothetical protein
MDASGLSYVYVSAAVAIAFFVMALILAVQTSRHVELKESAKHQSVLRRLLSGESLTETGMKYRIAVFIALMFAFMNTIGTVVIFLATQMNN